MKMFLYVTAAESHTHPPKKRFCNKFKVLLFLSAYSQLGVATAHICIFMTWHLFYGRMPFLPPTLSSEGNNKFKVQIEKIDSQTKLINKIEEHCDRKIYFCLIPEQNIFNVINRTNKQTKSQK